MRQVSSSASAERIAAERVPEARYAYYRRCQVFRKCGQQCKAPAEKDSHICYAHAGQVAMALRRERERRAVLEEAVAEMRRRGKAACEAKDLFMDFKGIQITLTAMAQALIAGRIDCKTAGRLVVELQTFSKLLWEVQRAKIKTLPRMNTDNTDVKGAARPEEPRLPQICAYECRLNKSGDKAHLTTEAPRRGEQPNAAKTRDANRREEPLIAFVPKVLALADIRSWAHGPPGWARAA